MVTAQGRGNLSQISLLNNSLCFKLFNSSSGRVRKANDGEKHNLITQFEAGGRQSIKSNVSSAKRNHFDTSTISY